MFNSETLEVGIGMAFLFLLMSLICTGVKEWIEGVLKWRAMDLERAFRTLLDDEHGRLTAFLYAHPLISSLYQGRYDPARLTDSSSTSWLTGGANARHMALSARRNLPSYVPAGHFARALIDLVARGPADVDAESAPHTPLSIPLLRERAAALASPFVRRAVLSAIDHCDGDLQKLTENLQHWFDGSMDRASGWYKRRTQAVLFVLGLAAAAVMNVDALYVMGRLTTDKTFRESVVSAAAKFEMPAAASGAASGAALATALQAREALETIGMPMGWRQFAGSNALKPTQMCRAEVAERCVETGYSIIRVAFGWLMSAFAIMLGAPFWFDILNKIMVIRATVKPREKSREEGSEDRTDPADKSAAVAATAVLAQPPHLARPETPPDTSTPVQPFVPHEWRDGPNPREIAL